MRFVAEKESRLRTILIELRSHILWDAIKLLAVLMIPTAYVVLQKFRRLNWDWFVFGGLFVLSAIVFLIDRFSRPRVSKSKKMPELIAQAPAVPDKRIFVGERITPKYLRDLFKDQTTVQAERVFEPFKGKWIRVWGTISDIHAHPPRSVQVLIYEEPQAFSGLSLSFNWEWNERLSIIARGEKIEAVGRIKSAHVNSLFLDDCELVD